VDSCIAGWVQVLLPERGGQTIVLKGHVDAVCRGHIARRFTSLVSNRRICAASSWLRPLVLEPVVRNSCHPVGNDAGKQRLSEAPNVRHAKRTIGGDSVDLCDVGKGGTVLEVQRTDARLDFVRRADRREGLWRPSGLWPTGGVPAWCRP